MQYSILRDKPQLKALFRLLCILFAIQYYTHTHTHSAHTFKILLCIVYIIIFYYSLLYCACVCELYVRMQLQGTYTARQTSRRRAYKTIASCNTDLPYLYTHNANCGSIVPQAQAYYYITGYSIQAFTHTHTHSH